MTVWNTAKESIESAIENWDVSIERLRSWRGVNKENFRFSEILPSLSQKTDTSIQDVEDKFRSVTELVLKLCNVEETFLIPRPYIESFESQCNTLDQQVHSQLVSPTNNLEATGRRNGDHMQIYNQRGQSIFNVDGSLSAIYNQLDALLDWYYRIAMIADNRSYPKLAAQKNVFSKFTQSIRERLNKLDVEYSEHKPLYDEVHKLHSAAQEKRDSTQDILTKAEEALLDINSINNETKETMALQKAQSSGFISEIAKAVDRAKDLHVSVDVYDEQFKKFDKELKNRNDNYSALKSEAEALKADMSSLIEQLKGHEEEARGVLGKAVVAGLSGNFKKIVAKLDKDVSAARWVYYCSLVFLLISTFVVVTNGMGRIPLESIKDAQNEYALISAIFWKFMLIAPAVLFVRFSSKRHQSLFELKEHYAYKESIASSVEGFKAQSGEHKDLIAAATFFELTFNPIDHVDGNADDAQHPNPVMERLARIIESRKT